MFSRVFLSLVAVAQAGTVLLEPYGTAVGCVAANIWAARAAGPAAWISTVGKPTKLLNAHATKGATLLEATAALDTHTYPLDKCLGLADTTAVTSIILTCTYGSVKMATFSDPICAVATTAKDETVVVGTCQPVAAAKGWRANQLNAEIFSYKWVSGADCKTTSTTTAAATTKAPASATRVLGATATLFAGLFMLA